MRLTGNHHYGLCHDAFPAAELAALRHDIMASPHLGGNRLSTSFDGTLGFSMVFTRSGVDEAVARFPYLATFVARSLRPTCNAFYLNPLVMRAGSAIAPHVDCSLSSYLGGGRTAPLLVSVLYVDVPDDLVGGELVMLTDDDEVGRVQPRAGTLLYFGGRLRHHVTPVATAHTRLSLVCEQYKLDDAALARVPTFELLAGVRGYEEP